MTATTTHINPDIQSFRSCFDQWAIECLVFNHLCVVEKQKLWKAKPTILQILDLSELYVSSLL